MNLHSILKRNPYHDRLGRFTFAHNANFVSLWAKQLKTFPKQEDKREYAEEPFEHLDAQANKYLDDSSDSYIGEAAVSAIHGYTGSLYQYLNLLKKGKTDIRDYYYPLSNKENFPKYLDNLRKQSKEIDEGLDKTTLGKDMMLYRGFGYDSQLGKSLAEKIAGGDTLVGTTIDIPQYVSTTVRKSSAEGWSGSRVMFAIRAKKESRGLYVDSISDNAGEWEVLLPSKSKFLVRKVSPFRLYSDDSDRHLVEVDLLT